MPGGRLPETENKRVRNISCLQSSRDRLRNLSSARLRERVFETVFERETNIYKVVAFGRCSLTRSGRCVTSCERIDCTNTKHI